jgi:hypothetical protein
LLAGNAQIIKVRNCKFLKLFTNMQIFLKL